MQPRKGRLPANTRLIIGGGLKDGERCVEITRANDYHELSDLQSNQEEADTRMLLHAKYAASERQEINIVI